MGRANSSSREIAAMGAHCAMCGKPVPAGRGIGTRGKNRFCGEACSRRYHKHGKPPALSLQEWSEKQQNLERAPSKPREPRLTRKGSAAIDALAAGATHDEAAQAAGMNPRALARLLKTGHARSCLIDRTVAINEARAPRALKRIADLSEGAESEYVALSASQDIANRAGIRRPEAHQQRPTGGVRIQFISVEAPPAGQASTIIIDGVSMPAPVSHETPTEEAP